MVNAFFFCNHASSVALSTSVGPPLWYGLKYLKKNPLTTEYIHCWVLSFTGLIDNKKNIEYHQTYTLGD